MERKMYPPDYPNMLCYKQNIFASSVTDRLVIENKITKSNLMTGILHIEHGGTYTKQMSKT
jgi:hypothetical protein